MIEERSNASPKLGPMAMTFVAGATLGALVVALTTPKSGPELRGDLKKLAKRAKRRADDLSGQAGDLWDQVRGRAGQAAAELEHGASDAAKDLQA